MKPIAFLLAAALAACRPAPFGSSFEPPAGKRAVAIAVDKSQSQFLEPGDAVEVAMMVSTPRLDDTTDTRSEILSPRAEVLRVKGDWAAGTGLVSLALTPEEAQYAALAVEREDRIFLNKLPADGARLVRRAAAGAPAELEKGHRGLALLVFPDQQELLAPGDRVDLISTRQSFKAAGKSELTALTLLQDILVLRASPPAGDEDEWSAVQVMVDDEQAKRLTRAVAGDDHLTLAVRARADRETRPVEPAKMSRKVGTQAERASPKT